MTRSVPTYGQIECDLAEPIGSGLSNDRAKNRTLPHHATIGGCFEALQLGGNGVVGGVHAKNRSWCVITCLITVKSGFPFRPLWIRNLHKVLHSFNLHEKIYWFINI
jgi:hypothetical protein